MRRYTIDEGHFEIPEEWSDKSVNVFATSDKLPGDFSFVITRDSLESHQNLETYFEEQLTGLSKTMPKFKLIGRYRATVDQLPAMGAEFTWDTEGKTMVQRQTYAVYKQVVLVLTATAIEKFSRDYQLILENIISSFRMTR
jgi:hypothetical protein